MTNHVLWGSHIILGTPWLAGDLGASGQKWAFSGDSSKSRDWGLFPPTALVLQKGSQCRWEAGLEDSSSQVLSSSVIGCSPVQGYSHPAGVALNPHTFLFSSRWPWWCDFTRTSPVGGVNGVPGDHSPGSCSESTPPQPTLPTMGTPPGTHQSRWHYF